MTFRTLKRAQTVLVAAGALALGACSAQPGPASSVRLQSYVEMTETNLTSQAVGKVKEVLVSEGDSIKAGQDLLILDSDTLEAQKIQAAARIETVKSQIRAATASATLAKTNYSRVKGLSEKGMISQADYDNALTQTQQADANLDVLQGQLAQAQGALAELQTYLNRTTLISPGDGVVTQINTRAGETVSTGLPLVVITEQKRPWIECDLRETDLSLVRRGEVVNVEFPAYPNQKFHGTVTRINKNADFATKRATNENGQFDIRSFGVKVELSGDHPDLYAGMTAFVTFGKL
jgi:HlyD family secretion protein